MSIDDRGSSRVTKVASVEDETATPPLEIASPSRMMRRSAIHCQSIWPDIKYHHQQQQVGTPKSKQ
jgi:hypothetical protein